MEQWPSFGDTRVYFAAVIFLAWHLYISSQKQKSIWPQSMARACQLSVSLIHLDTPKSPGKTQSAWAVVESGACDEKDLDCCGLILNYFHAKPTFFSQGWAVAFLGLGILSVLFSLGHPDPTANPPTPSKLLRLQKLAMHRELTVQGISACSWCSVYDKGWLAPSSFSTTKLC